MQDMMMGRPPGWLDKSMIIMSAPSPDRSGVTANMVVTRDMLPKGLPETNPERMHALLDRQVAEMRERLARFQEKWRKSDDDHPVAEIFVHWETPQGPVAQWVTFADLGPDAVQAGGDMMVATATSGRAEFDDHAATFREMLQTLTSTAPVAA